MKITYDPETDPLSITFCEAKLMAKHLARV